MASYDLPENITVKREGGGGSVDLKHRNKTNSVLERVVVGSREGLPESEIRT